MFDPIIMNAEDTSVEYELSSLESAELLDIWQQTQEMEYNLKYELGQNVVFSIDLEKIIVHVLQARSHSTTSASVVSDPIKKKRAKKATLQKN